MPNKALRHYAIPKITYFVLKNEKCDWKTIKEEFIKFVRDFL